MNPTKTRFSNHALLLVLCSVCLSACSTPHQTTNRTTATTAAVTPTDSFRELVFSLASAEFAGRGYGFDGHLLAADYIADQFASAGLHAVDSSYLHPFMLEADPVLATPHLVVGGDTLEPGIDYVPIRGSYGGTVLSAAASFVGEGLISLENSVNDYQGFAPGNLAVASSDHNAERINTEVERHLLSTSAKIKYAELAGATGLIVLTDQLVSRTNRHGGTIPAFLVKKSAWPTGENVKVSLALTVDNDVTISTNNVIGIDVGDSIPDSFVVITAHYDHLGSLGPEIFFPGANDNASGVAMLIELAKHFESVRQQKSLVFVATSGEELGLLGAKAFVDAPPVALSKVAFVLNLDMVGSGRDGLTVVGAPEQPALYRQLHGAAEEFPYEIFSRSMAPNSDQYPFHEAGVPAIYTYTTNGRQPYHSVEDVAATLDFELMGDVFDLLVGFLRQE